MEVGLAVAGVVIQLSNRESVSWYSADKLRVVLKTAGLKPQSTAVNAGIRSQTEPELGIRVEDGVLH